MRDLEGAFRLIFKDRFDEPAREWLAKLQRSKGGGVKGTNFGSGTGGEWRQAFPKDVQVLAFANIPEPVREMLSLSP